MKVHRIDPRLLRFKKPKVHRIQIEDFMTKSGAENTNTGDTEK